VCRAQEIECSLSSTEVFEQGLSTEGPTQMSTSLRRGNPLYGVGFIILSTEGCVVQQAGSIIRLFKEG